jgi:hypothetical protein
MVGKVVSNSEPLQEPKTTPVTSLEARRPCQTLSGAHIRELSDTATKEFLQRMSTPMMEPIRMALGAFEDSGALVGVLAVTGSAGCVSTVHVAVSADRRRLKIGTDLLSALVADDLNHVGTPLRLCRAINADAAAALRTQLDQTRCHRRL